jgi:hypothetical protein
MRPKAYFPDGYRDTDSFDDFSVSGFRSGRRTLGESIRIV